MRLCISVHFVGSMAPVATVAFDLIGGIGNVASAATSKRFVPALGKRTVILQKAYREGKAAEPDWTQVISRERNPHPVVADSAADSAEAAQNEYLRALMVLGDNYRIHNRPAAAPTAPQAPAGQPAGPAAPSEPVHFQLLRTAHAHSRPKLLPTADDADDVSVTAPLALLVQKQSIWLRPQELEPADSGTVEVLAEGEPVWVTPRQLATFLDLSQTLTKF